MKPILKERKGDFVSGKERIINVFTSELISEEIPNQKIVS
jgi:hypothetical protein